MGIGFRIRSGEETKPPAPLRVEGEFVSFENWEAAGDITRARRGVGEEKGEEEVAVEASLRGVNQSWCAPGSSSTCSRCMSRRSASLHRECR